MKRFVPSLLVLATVTILAMHSVEIWSQENQVKDNVAVKASQSEPAAKVIEKPLDRQNARSVVEAYVAAALAGRVDEAVSLAQGTPAGRKQIESLSKQLYVQRLVIKSVYVNDPAKPKTALALSEAVTLPKKEFPVAIPVTVGLTLTLSEEGWLVTDIVSKPIRSR